MNTVRNSNPTLIPVWLMIVLLSLVLVITIFFAARQSAGEPAAANHPPSLTQSLK
jgi:hypothetical protein